MNASVSIGASLLEWLRAIRCDKSGDSDKRPEKAGLGVTTIKGGHQGEARPLVGEDVKQMSEKENQPGLSETFLPLSFTHPLNTHSHTLSLSLSL